MAEFVSSGQVALLALVVLTIESVALALWRRHCLSPPTTLDIVLMALPGACLLLALYCALAMRGWPALAGCLGAALAAHVADVARRWRPHFQRPSS